MSPSINDFKTVGIVNRGEAATRFIRALRDYNAEHGMDLASVALYTDADKGAPFMQLADRAVALGPAMRPASASDAGDNCDAGNVISAYTDHAFIIDTLVAAGCDAVWPGWGFVAEDHAFVAALEARGITFIGPDSVAMHRLGDKIAAKQLAEQVDVPMAPWCILPDSACEPAGADELAELGARIGFPLVVKAAAGGGGRGIRMVNHAEELPAALQAVRAEVVRSFGAGGILLEACVTSARHIEIQLVVDAAGKGHSLGLRDCSIQRRHQKVIEEAPSPVVDGPLARRLEEAAVRLGEHSGYRGVGTVEFLVDPARDFAHFLEVNTRLQVEHTVTEAIFGVDLVHAQIDIARGVPWAPPTSAPRGHAIEARLNAEDPERDFQPSPGIVRVFQPPLGPGIRIDSGIAEGVAVAPEFDSMIAKLIVWGHDRPQAIARMRRALGELKLVVEDGATNKSFVRELLTTPDYVNATADTGWLDRRQKDRAHSAVPGGAEALAVVAILRRERSIEAAITRFFDDARKGIPFRFQDSEAKAIEVSLRGVAHTIEAYAANPVGADDGPSHWRVGPPDHLKEVRWERTGERSATLFTDAGALPILFTEGRGEITVEACGHTHRLALLAGGQVNAPAPSLVVAIDVAIGDHVEAGQRLCTLEAMKMEVPVHAREAGVIKAVACRPNEQVGAGQVLFHIDKVTDADADTDDDDAESASPGASDDDAQAAILPSPLAQLATEAGRQAFADLDDQGAADAAAFVTDAARSILLGADHPQSAEVELQAFLSADLDGFCSSRCELWQPLVQTVGCFADVDLLFERLLEADHGAESRKRAERVFFELCRNVDNAEHTIDPSFEPLMRRALAHYAITEPLQSLERPAVRRLLWYMAVAHARVEARHDLVSGLLRLLIALHRGGVRFDGDRQMQFTLARVAEASRPGHPGVKDRALQARYLLFRRSAEAAGMVDPIAAALASKVISAAGSAAGGGATRPATPALGLLRSVYGDDAAVTELPGPAGLEQTLKMWQITTTHGIPAVAIVTQAERLLPKQSGGQSGVQSGGQSGTQSGTHSGTQSGTAEAVCEALDAHASGYASGTLELHIYVAGQGDAGAELAVATELLEGAPALARVTVTWTADGRRARHIGWLPDDAGWVEDERLRDVHPERARHLEMWRLDHFNLERVAPETPLLAFRAQAKSNARDERVFVLGELSAIPSLSERANAPVWRSLHATLAEALRIIREEQARRPARRRYFLNRVILRVQQIVTVDSGSLAAISRRLEGATRGLGLQKIVLLVRAERQDAEGNTVVVPRVITVAKRGRHRLEIHESSLSSAPIRAASDYHLKAERARRLGAIYPYEMIRALSGTPGADAALTPHPDMAEGHFVELDLDRTGNRLAAVARPPGENTAGVVVGLITHVTRKHPEGMTRVWIGSDPTKSMGALAEPECRRIICAMDLAEQRRLPIEWLPISAGAKIAMDSGTENLDWTAKVLKRITAFTQAGGAIHIIVGGVNVGAQSYWNAEATMLMHTRGVLIQTDDGSMVLTGKRALEASGGVAAEDERGIGGYDRIMGPNGQAQFHARDLGDAYRIMFEHYACTYIMPGESAPRRLQTADPTTRRVTDAPYRAEHGETFTRVGDVFSDASNPGRKKPFAIREVMRATLDQDGQGLERFAGMAGAETALVWNGHLGGHSVCLIGFESRPLSRRGDHPLDGPDTWTGGTLFPNGSKKVARAINQASGRRPVVVLANLSGFDGSPESMRRLQLEYGAEIGRAVVNFDGPIVFVVIGRYHGGAYVVFSKALNPELTSMAIEGSYASVIGGAPAATVVFPREVKKRAEKDARILALRAAIDAADASGDKPKSSALGSDLLTLRADLLLEYRGIIAKEFDAIHTVQRAVAVGSLDAVIRPEDLRESIVAVLDRRQAVTGRAERPRTSTVHIHRPAPSALGE